MTPLMLLLAAEVDVGIDDKDFVDWRVLVAHLWRMLLAYALAMPVAWNRERVDRSAGLRTFPLVAIASCAYVLIAKDFLTDVPDAMARILQGLITGIGFVGGGAILKQDNSTKGTATAASIWSTGALGAAVAFDRFEIALLLSFINWATFRWLTGLKQQADS